MALQALSNMAISYYSLVFPSIVESPVSTICTAAGHCNLTCSTKGVPTPTVDWYRDDNQIWLQEDSQIQFLNSTSFVETNSTLAILMADSSHAGFYRCVASNSLVEDRNVTSSTALVQVHCELRVLRVLLLSLTQIPIM